MSATDLVTVEDAVEHLLDAFNVQRGSRNKRIALRAVYEAIRVFPMLHNWVFYERRGQITTVAEYSTGTIAYDHTGGSSERLVTLTGGTWPATDLKLYKIIIGSVQYQVDEWKSSTTLTLTEDSNPGADVAASTSYQLYKSKFALPSGLRRIAGDLDNHEQNRPISYVSPAMLLALQQGDYDPQDTDVGDAVYTLYGDNEILGQNILEIAPPPGSAGTYDYLYESEARQPTLKADRYTTGTVSNSGATVTGVSTAWSDKMVGCMLRFAVDENETKPPSGLNGGIDDDANPYAEQHRIKTVGSATSITLETTPTGSFSAGTPYSISDPVDIDPITHQDAFLREAEYRYSRLAGRDDRGERQMAAKEAMHWAMAGSTRQRGPHGSPVSYLGGTGSIVGTVNGTPD